MSSKFNFKRLCASALLTVSLLGAGVSVAGSTQAYAFGDTTLQNTTSESVDRLIDDVYSKLSEKTYRTETGEGVNGTKIFNNRGEITDKYDNLTNKDKTQVLKDIDSEADKLRTKDKESIAEGNEVTNAVTKGTTSRFWDKVKRSNSTVSAYMIGAATDSVAVDFNSATELLAPIIPWFNTGMGVFLILASLSFFLFIAVDVFYFFAPPFQLVVSSWKNEKGFKGVVGGGFVTPYAKSAFEDYLSKGKNPLISYMGKTWLILLCYATVLLFFATHATLTLVGPIAGLIANALGFN